MKTLFLSLILFLPSIQPARAGGPATGGASEYTQILNNVQLADAFAQQVQQYQNQLLQYDSMLKNLAAHPLGNISPTLGTIVAGQARVIAGSRDIGNTMAKVDSDFAAQFKSPQATSFSDQFKGWTNYSDDALKASMLNAGLQRENFESDEAALVALVNKNQASDGNLGAVKTLGEINAAQLQESMKLRDLINRQQTAQNVYMATQNSKAQATQDMNDAVGKSTAAPSSTPSSRRYKY